MAEAIINQSNISTPGNVTAGGNVAGNQFSGQVSTTAPTPSGSGTLSTSQLINRYTGSGGAAITGLDLAAGTFPGQLAAILNEVATVADTLSISGAHVLLDASSDAIIVKAASAELFIWDPYLNSNAGLWVHVGGFAG